jgi:hypothetical protein
MRRDVTIAVPVAKADQRAPAEFTSHHCPLCGVTFEWDAFREHAPACIAAHPEAAAGDGEAWA